MEIEKEAYPEPWTAGMFREEIRSKRSFFYTAWLGDSLIGYSGFWLVLDEGHITSLTVRRDYRGYGYGAYYGGGGPYVYYDRGRRGSRWGFSLGWW